MMTELNIASRDSGFHSGRLNRDYLGSVFPVPWEPFAPFM